MTGEPWAAYNYYLGGLRSRIAINTDVAMTPDFAAELAAHEAYPGHHTEQVTKEQTLVRDQGRLEQSILLIGTPQALISEGIAVLGSEIMLGEDEERLTAQHVAPLDVEYDPELSKLVKKAREPLEDGVATNAALLLHSEGASVDEARDYLMRWSLVLGTEGRSTDLVHLRSDLARVRVDLCGRLSGLPRLRRRRPPAVQAAPDRAADPGRFALARYRLRRGCRNRARVPALHQR